MVVLERSFWPAALSVAYVCAAAWQGSGAPLGPWALLLLPLGVFVAWRYTARNHAHPNDPSATTLKACLRASVWGVLLWLAARVAPAGHSTFESIANLGVGTATVAACVSLASIPAAGGMLRPHPSAQSVDAAVFCTLIWSIAIAAPLARVWSAGSGAWLDPLAIDFTTTTAATASLLVLIASAWRTLITRRLELGVADRASGALALAATAFATAVPAAAANVAAPDRVMPLGALCAALAVVLTVRARDAASIARVLRITVTVMLLGVPLTLTAAVLAATLPARAPLIVLLSALGAVGIGLLAQVISRPLNLERARWLGALEAASRGALEPEPDAALVATLRGLERSHPSTRAHCEIWQRYPEQSFSVDIAGYLQTEKAQAPPSLYELAQGEPLQTLRTEVLKALEVRKPEVRPLLAWLEIRGAQCVSLIAEGNTVVGFLLVPKERRRSVMSIEEVEALHLLTGRIGALLAVSSALGRSVEREAEAQARALTLQDTCNTLQQAVSQRSDANRTFAETLARPIRTSLYSAAARMSAAELERYSRLRQPLTLDVPPGVDALGWAAFTHLADPTRNGPLIVIDASTIPAEQTPWKNDAAWLVPDATLLVLGCQALSVADREQHLDLLIQRLAPPLQPQVTHPDAPPVEPAKPTLILALCGPPQVHLAQWLARHFERGALVRVTLPRLIERPEDLQAIIFEQLARLWPSSDGEPLGIEPRALRHLVDQSWPGNDAELKGALMRAAARCRGPRITLDDLVDLEAPSTALLVSQAPHASLPSDLSFSSAARRRHSPRKH